jgi:hypothetical protein
LSGLTRQKPYREKVGIFVRFRAPLQSSKPFKLDCFHFFRNYHFTDSYFIIEKLTPKYLETNYRKNNTAVAIVFGALIIGFQ